MPTFMTQESTAPQAPPVPALPSRPGAATGAEAAGAGQVAGAPVAGAPVAGAPVAGAPVAGAVNAARDGATATRNALRDIRDEIRIGIREGMQAQGPVGEGIIVVPPPPVRRESPIPPEVLPIVAIVMGAVVVMTLVAPIIRAVIRAFERRADRNVVRGSDIAPQLKQLQQSVDAMAIEVERIGEAQRFQAKLLAEREGRAVLPAERRGGA